jgi:hypothetical protein
MILTDFFLNLPEIIEEKKMKIKLREYQFEDTQNTRHYQFTTSFIQPLYMIYNIRK